MSTPLRCFCRQVQQLREEKRELEMTIRVMEEAETYTGPKNVFMRHCCSNLVVFH